MAGGVGSRFWPKSKQSLPKQFLDFLGTGETLIQQTYKRFSSFVDDENFLVVTNAAYKDLVLEQLPALNENQVLLEPEMRNTAPCIAYAVHKIAAIADDANLIITPADHLILRQAAFETVMKKCLAHTANNNDLLTLGITPSRPDTGYGYIESEMGEGEIKKVKQFREKPDLATAKEFISQENFSWNSGMFVWSLKTILQSIERDLPQINSLFAAGKDHYHTSEEQAFIDSIYHGCESISIDYGIMEKADNVFTINADIGWSDLGTWGSVYTLMDKDASKNAAVGDKILLNEGSDNLVQSIPGKVTVIDGLHDFIVVDTKESLMIIRKEKEQEIKQLRAKVGEQFGNDFI